MWLTDKVNSWLPLKNLHGVNAAHALFALQASLNFNTFDHNDIELEKKIALPPPCLKSRVEFSFLSSDF